MSSAETQADLSEYTDEEELAECRECGRSAMNEETPCSRCQPPTPQDDKREGEGEDYSKEQCQNCGSHVSERFRRVRGDNQNVAHACRECAPRNHEYPYAVAGVETESIPVIQR